MAVQDARLIEQWRKGAYLLPCLALALAIGLSAAMSVSWDMGDCFGLTLSLMLIGAGIAMLGTRSPVPLADTWLAAADRALPLSAMDIVIATSRLPDWAISALHKVYVQTGPYLFVSLIALHLTDRSSIAWRMFLIWGSSFLAIGLLAFTAPALGCFSQLSPAEVAHLPGGAGRYAMAAFNEFRSAPEPVISFAKISGVITFPSFHTVCALLIAKAWHGVRVAGPLTKLLTGAIIFSCVPMGGHYLVDLAAGAAVWWAATVAVDRLGRPQADNSAAMVTVSATA